MLASGPKLDPSKLKVKIETNLLTKIEKFPTSSGSRIKNRERSGKPLCMVIEEGVN